MLLVLTLSLTVAKKSEAFDPITIAGAFVSPVFCKMIGCKTSEYIFVEYPEKNHERLNEISNAFNWDELTLKGFDTYQEGDCTKFMTNTPIDNKYTGNACYIKGKWKIQPNEEYCFGNPFSNECSVSSIR